MPAPCLHAPLEIKLSHPQNATYIIRSKNWTDSFNFTMKINQKYIEAGLNNNYWDLGNSYLYKLCKEYPKHESIPVILAKTWLIGRSYSVPLERKKWRTEKKMPVDGFYEKRIGPLFQSSKLDSYLENLSKLHTINNDAHLLEVLKTHYYLMEIIKNETKQQNRSFVSKYLHFHLPNLFFIYDSQVDKVAISIYTTFNHASYRPKVKSKEIDKQYGKFCEISVVIKRAFEEKISKLITLREYDKILLEHAKNINFL